MLRFDLENIGPISKASVEVGGLTVLTGTNGTEKSTTRVVVLLFLDKVNS